MKISDAQLRIEIGANLTPETPNFSGPTHVGLSYLAQPPATKAVLVARLFFSAAAQTAAINPLTGTISLSAVGTQQVVTRGITAPAGVTSAGLLSFSFTSAAMLASPTLFNMPVNPTEHSTATELAAAVAAYINKVMVGITAKWKVTSKDARVIFTAIYAFGFDGTAGLAITSGLGVSAGDTAGAVSGTLGVISQRQGGQSKDIFSDPWDVKDGFITDISLHCLAGAVTVASTARTLKVGQHAAFSDPFGNDNFTSETFTSLNVPAVVDVIALCK